MTVVAPHTGLAGLRERLPEGGWLALLLGAFALYYVAPGLPLSLVALLLCATLCYLCLPLAVSLIPLAMPFFMLPKSLSPSGHADFSLGETAIVLCAGSFVLQQIGDALASGTDLRAWLRRVVPAPTLTAAAGLFLLAATLATLHAFNRHTALREWRTVIVEPLAYYLLASALLRDTAAMRRSLWAVVGAGTLVALLGLGQYLFRYKTLSGLYYPPGSTTPQPLHLVTAVYGSPDNLGLLLDRALPVALLLALSAWRVRRVEATRGTHWLAWGGIAVMAIALLLSGSRGGLITAAVVGALGALLWYGRRNRRIEVGLLVLVVVGVTAVLLRVQHGLSTNRRVEVWRSALQMIRDHPLFGVGPDNFLYYYVNPKLATVTCLTRGTRLPGHPYMNDNAWQEPCLSHPHNIVLDLWLSTGLLGLVAAVLLFVAWGWSVRHLLQRSTGGGPARTIALACVCIVAATLLHGLVDNALFLPDLAVDLWLALALTGTLSSPPRHAMPPPRQ